MAALRPRHAAIATLLLASTMTMAGTEDSCGQARTRALIETDRGQIRVELFDRDAPATVDNFLAYAREGFYAGTIFHRVIPGFMIQGGGLTEALEPKPTPRPPIVNESGNGRSNERGTLAMARTRDPDSARAQFFINLVDNQRLDGRPQQPGYAVFGRVTSGMDVVDAIAAVETTTRGPYRDVPREPVHILGVRVLEDDCPPATGSGSEGDGST